jgi:signal transduction histidine kinase
MSSVATSPETPRYLGGIGARLALLFGGAFLFAFAALALGAREMARTALVSLADRVLAGELQELEGRLPGPDSHGADAEATRRAIVAYVKEEVEDESAFGLSYRITREGGAPLAEAPEGAWAAVPRWEGGGLAYATVREPGAAHARRVVAERRLVPPLGRLGLEISYDLAPAEDELARIARLLFLAAPIALALAVIGGFFLARRALAPLREIEAVARRVSARPAGERAPETGRGDEVDRLARSLNAMLDRLEAAIEADARFTADAAHELRTPLQALKADVELARAEGGAGAALERVAGHVERLSALVRDLLTLSRADHAVLAPRERVALGPMLAELVEDLRPLGEERGVALAAGALAPVEVSGDSGALRRLFANLIENACLYADPGPVRVEVARENGAALVLVEDGGPGLSDEERGQLFSRFWRAELGRSRNPAGTGLGLSIAAAIARAHGGGIAASRAANGRGTSFRVSLSLG